MTPDDLRTVAATAVNDLDAMAWPSSAIGNEPDWPRMAPRRIPQNRRAPQPRRLVEWGVRYDDGRVERCSEATAKVLAAPGVTPVSRVVGAWQDTTPNPPAQTPKENR